nr:YncE family protein [Desulfobulbaceae bacterium]
MKQFHLYLLMGFIVLGTGCVSSGTTGSAGPLKVPTTYNKSAPLVSLFMHSDEMTGPGVSITIESIELFDGQQWLSFLDKSFRYDSGFQKNEQVFVNRLEVNPGEYSKIKITVSNAEMVDSAGSYQMALESNTVVIDLPVPLLFKQYDRQCLFVVFDKQASLNINNKLFRPVFRAYPQEISLTSELAYVSCPDIDTVFIVRSDTNRVVGSWSVTGKPTYLKAFKDSDEIYILAEKEHAIKIYQLSSGRLKDTITVPLIVNPAVMVINSSKTNAYLLDSASDFAYRVDLSTKSYATRMRIGEKPEYLVYVEDQQRLAISSQRSQKIYFLDPITLATLDTISAGSGSSGMYPYDGKLFIAESSSNSVMSYNFRSGKVLRNTVGMGPQRIIEYDDQLFVTNEKSGTVSVLLPDQLTTLKEIRTGGKPHEMALSSNRRWLYYSDVSKGSVGVIDLTSHRLKTTIDLGAVPLDIEIIN